jgi:hypothetical protein
VIYEITHLTRYTYGANVELTTGVLRLAPRAGDGQRVERFEIVTDPPSQLLTERVDPFGNRVMSLRIDKPHRQLSIKASSRVRVNRAPLPTLSPAWENVVAETAAIPSLDADSPTIALFPSRRISLFDEATAYAKKSFIPERPIIDAASELARRIRSDFVYDTRRVPGFCSHNDCRAPRDRPARPIRERVHSDHPAARQKAPGGRGCLSCVDLVVVRRDPWLARLRSNECDADPKRSCGRRQGQRLFGRLACRKRGLVVWEASA